MTFINLSFHVIRPHDYMGQQKSIAEGQQSLTPRWR